MEIRKLLSGRPAKQCSLDHVPSWIVKKATDIIAPLLYRNIYVYSPQGAEHEKKRGTTYRHTDRHTDRKTNKELYYTLDKRTPVNAS